MNKIEKETETYSEEVEAVTQTITEEGNYRKPLIGKKVESLPKLVQDRTYKEQQNMSAYWKVYIRVLANCTKWQKNIKKMETTTGVLLLEKLKQFKTDVDQINLKHVPDVPSVSYNVKKNRHVQT